MTYPGRVVEGTFISRPNRFVAYADIGGRVEKCHVKNTGRCRELLVPGCRIYLEESANTGRSTKYDLVAVEKKREGLPPLLINMDSQAPNKAVEEWLLNGGLFGDGAAVRREVTYGASRFDFAITDRNGGLNYLEVKGCTLEEGGIAAFPDAPTERGVKHIRHLVEAKREGYGAYLFILVQMKGIKKFVPNWKTHREFGLALREAEKEGVKILAYDSVVTPQSLVVDSPVEVDLLDESLFSSFLNERM